MLMDYKITYVDLPCKVKAFTSYTDGFYNIFVNSRLNIFQQESAIRHELVHIKKEDFADKPIAQCEKVM